MGRVLMLVFCALVSTACYNAKIRAPVAPAGEKISDTGVSFFWGMTNTSTQALECPHGMAYAEVYWPWWSQFLVSPLTLGIITPVRKVYQCAAPPAQVPQVILMQAPAAVAPVPAALPAPAPTAAPKKKD